MRGVLSRVTKMPNSGYLYNENDNNVNNGNNNSGSSNSNVNGGINHIMLTPYMTNKNSSNLPAHLQAVPKLVEREAEFEITIGANGVQSIKEKPPEKRHLIFSSLLHRAESIKAAWGRLRCNWIRQI